MFFPALTTLRFFAAFAVLIHHIELYKKRCGIENVIDAFLIQQLGHQSINSFCFEQLLVDDVASARSRKNADDRCAKILCSANSSNLSVYGVIVFIAFLIVPLCAPRILTQHELKHFETTTPFLSDALLLYLLMLPNFCAMFFTRFIAASHLWSVAKVEEQFYLFWSASDQSLSSATSRSSFGVLSGICSCGKRRTHFADTSLGKELPLSQLQLWNIYCVCECVNSLALCFRMMLFGAAAAVMFAGGYYRVLYRGSARILILAGVTALMVIPYSRSDLPLGILFALLIVSLTDSRIKLLASRPLVYLGSISYGIYMYHAIVLQCLMKCAENFDPSTSNAFIYLTALPAVLAISALSYRFFFRTTVLAIERQARHSQKRHDLGS